jgi:hypothetical protein
LRTDCGLSTRLAFYNVPAETPPLRGELPSLDSLCKATDQVLALVDDWGKKELFPSVRDTNDHLLMAAFARAYRCLNPSATSPDEVKGKMQPCSFELLSL